MQVKPFLMFQGRAEEAMQLYVRTFPGSTVDEVIRYGTGEAGAVGSVARAAFTIAGQKLMCIDSPIQHAFAFTPSFSLFVECCSEEEMTRIFNALAEGGEVMMPLDNYGFSKKFAWLSDRFGVSWQLNVA